ncbi:MAG: FecR domain-containing protein [Tannerellaceae bacterium]|jgi:ferric-dicitrate binding protein FerR (iron transport regulator)|nr:FecR domain-containing protein [Tannerellaceae bacterium]
MEPKDMKITPRWNKSKEDVWDERFVSLEDGKRAKKTFLFRVTAWRCVAASVALLVACTFFAYAYTLTRQNGRNEAASFSLPDGSRVSLNTDSELRYKPYWWFIDRYAEMKGEACFEVKTGKEFTVASANNAVRVLGTAFNVLAREEVYQVTCLTGKIEVFAGKEKALLAANMRLTKTAGQLRIDEDVDAKQSVSWRENGFSFNGVPLSHVIAEIERYYHIRITSESGLEYFYTGNFSKDKEPEEILEIIGKPFGIHFSISK